MTDAGRQKQTGSRELALDILIEILEKGGFSHVVLRQALSKYQYLEKQDRALITRIVDGTVEYCIQLDYVIDRFSKTKTKKMKPLIRTVLRMSAYQILYMDRIPDSAVCNEAVKLVEKRRFQGLKGFVNGVLRTISREKDNLVFPDDSIRYAMPDWMIRMWNRSYGPEITKTILESFLRERPLSVRCNIRQADRSTIVESLEKQGVVVRDSGYLDSVLFLECIDHLEALEAFQKGWISVQDVSSGLTALAAQIQPGEEILDVCGAPGGKALHAAELLAGTGHVTVRDLSEYKASMIQENIDRMGFTNIHAEVWDALELDETWIEKADLVIADLPCSGLGIIGKKPDIKLRMTPEAAEELAALQRDILDVVWRYVKPGGRLVYSTCTIDRKENEENLAWFLENHPFRPVDLSGRLGEKILGETMKDGYIQLLPGVHPIDGFFISVVERE